jgi:hypothetical protein
VNSGFITPGNALTSTLYIVLVGAGIDPLQEDMPLNNNPLSADELADIETWINGIQ